MNSVCIVIPVSRSTFLDRVYASLELMDCDNSQTSLLTVVDGDMALYEQARNLTQQSKFAARLTVHRPGPKPLRDDRREERRPRIADVHNDLKQYVPQCEYVFLVEDDGLLPTYALQKLLKVYADYPYAGLVSGAEINRHGINCVGLWSVDDPYQTDRIESLLPPEYYDVPDDGYSVIEGVDAAGLFCCLTRRENYLTHEFKPFEDVLGPDVEWSLALRREGFKNYCDWSVRVVHKTEARDIKFSNTKLVKVVLTRFGNRWLSEITQA